MPIGVLSSYFRPQRYEYYLKRQSIDVKIWNNRGKTLLLQGFFQ